jgi:Rieske Fe-S protein
MSGKSVGSESPVSADGHARPVDQARRSAGRLAGRSGAGVGRRWLIVAIAAVGGGASTGFVARVPRPSAARPGAPHAGTTASAGPSVAPPAESTASTAGPVPAVHGPLLASLAAIPVGQSIPATGTGGRKLILTRTGPATVVAHSAVCTHLGCTVAPAGTRLQCPCHGSTFNPVSGAATHGPAQRPLAAQTVVIENGQVYQG